MDQPVLSNQPGSNNSNAPVAKMGITPTTGATNIQVYSQPEAKRAVILQPIQAAQQSIDLAVYFLTDQLVIAQLLEAAKIVTVRVMLDQHGYIGQKLTYQQIYNQLTAGGIQVKWGNTNLPAGAYFHEKTMVIDATTAYITTSNFDPTSLGGSGYNANTDHPEFANREYGVITSNPADVAAVSAIFNADWNGQPLDATTFAAPHLVVSPLNSSSVITDLLNGAPSGSTIQIEMEEFTDPDTASLLETAVTRNVSVQLLLSSGNRSIDASNNGFLSNNTSFVNNSGVQIKKLGQPLYMHAKLIIVAGLAFVGSQNLSQDSLLRNREMGILIADPDALTKLQNIFQLDWNNVNAVPVTTTSDGNAPTVVPASAPSMPPAPTIVPALSPAIPSAPTILPATDDSELDQP